MADLAADSRRLTELAELAMEAVMAEANWVEKTKLVDKLETAKRDRDRARQEGQARARSGDGQQQQHAAATAAEPTEAQQAKCGPSVRDDRGDDWAVLTGNSG